MTRRGSKLFAATILCAAISAVFLCLHQGGVYSSVFDNLPGIIWIIEFPAAVILEIAGVILAIIATLASLRKKRFDRRLFVAYVVVAVVLIWLIWICSHTAFGIFSAVYTG